jgi:DNA-binding winged helix-turn-helix (wHTH) protein/predicted ATPase
MTHQVRFGPFHLDLDAQQLWRQHEPVHLRPKTWEVLRHLAERAGHLVTKDELLSSVWHSVAVTESTLTKSIRELRVVLDDDAASPRFIETVHGRGFRFIGHALDDGAAAPATAMRTSETFVGREDELTKLRGYLTAALDGRRQVVFVTGEAGIGKTALVDAFVGALPPASRPVWIARGQCLQRYGAVETYKPVLEALGRLAAAPGGSRVVDALERLAPSWLAQLPGLSRSSPPATGEMTAGRMIWELATMLEALTADAALVLVLEDLHWSDGSTLDLIAELAQRREPARLLLLGTYRPVDAIVHDHPVAALKQQLLVRRQCHELALNLLPKDAVEAYVRSRLPGEATPAVAASLHHLTTGNPLFLTMLVDHLLAQGALSNASGRWQLATPLEDPRDSIPESLREMIDRQLGQLAANDLSVLEAASVAGAEFSVQMVVAATGMDAEDVETACAGLARRGQFLRALGSTTWPDGSEGARYAFVHALHQQILYDRVTAARRQRLHRSIGERLAAGWASRPSEVAAELAMHFERGRDYRQAMVHARELAARAIARGANREAIAASERALALLAMEPDTPDRSRQMLVLNMALGSALQTMHGHADPRVEETFERARQLGEQIQDVAGYFVALVGLTSLHVVRGHLATAGELANRLVALGEGMPVPGFAGLVHHLSSPGMELVARTLRGVVALSEGRLAAARGDLETAAAIETAPWTFRPNFKAICLGRLAYTLALCGETARARELDRRFLSGDGVRDIPYDQTWSLMMSGQLHMLLRDRAAALRTAEQGIVLAIEHGYPLVRGVLQFIVAWAHPGHDVERMIAGLDEVRALGTANQVPTHLGLISEALGNAGRASEGLEHISEAFDQVERHGERSHEAELHRIRGELLLRQRQPRSAAQTARASEAEKSFRRAIELARSQGAILWELRATTSLCRLRRHDTAPALAALCERFAEDTRLADLDDARTLLAGGR